MANERQILEVAQHVWGISEDAQFWDLFRCNGGNRRAAEYLRSALKRGVDLIGDAKRADLLQRLG